MAWLNSDDLIAPNVLRYVAEYFATHPDVDVIYGHRIIIDTDDKDVGRWVMPQHDAPSIEWIDYIPQETLFWRKRAWDAATEQISDNPAAASLLKLEYRAPWKHPSAV